MKTIIGCIGLAALALALSARAQSDRPDMESQTRATALLQSWPLNSRLTGTRLLEKYGPPDAVNDSRIVWNDHDPWSQITLFRVGAADTFPTTHHDIVENTIRYDVPQEKAGDILKFSPAIDIDRLSGTMSARSDSEGGNILALNLANEIVNGKRDVDSARDFMRATLSRAAAGKSSPYMDHLLFPVSKVEQPMN
jgi:hypothetical protein